MCKRCDQLQEFSHLIEQLLGNAPADAGSVIISKLAQELYRANQPRALENLLQLMWMQIATELQKHLDSTPKAMDAAAMFLERYFGHRGNWNAQAERHERDLIARYPDKAEWFAEVSARVKAAVAESIGEQAPAGALLN